MPLTDGTSFGVLVIIYSPSLCLNPSVAGYISDLLAAVAEGHALFAVGIIRQHEVVVRCQSPVDEQAVTAHGCFASLALQC